MKELSYAQALASGIEPILYRTDFLEELGVGSHAGVLDALVWAKRAAALMALVTLVSGPRVCVTGFQRHSRPDMQEYLGLRTFSPGDLVFIEIDIGQRRGLRPCLRQRA
jgi:hypothetical protein